MEAVGMGTAARELLLHPLVRGGLYGLAAALAVQSFFDTWRWPIFAIWGLGFTACMTVAVRQVAARRQRT